MNHDAAGTDASYQARNPDAFVPVSGVPGIFNGIWEGSDRYIMFQEKSELEEIVGTDTALKESEYIWVYLKLFYGWYVDRSAEKTSRADSPYAHDTNDAVFRDIQNIKIEFLKLFETDDCGVFEIVITYPNFKERTVVPVAVVGDSLYLDFAVRTDGSRDSMNGFWSAVPEVSGIKVSRPVFGDSLYSLYVTDECVYSIRYWQTDMEYSGAAAVFYDGGRKYEVPKHIQTAGTVFTCVNGRGTVVRNVGKDLRRLEDCVTDKNKTVAAFGAPYLTRIEKTCSLENMMKIVQTSNARRAPVPDPPFPPSNLDWHTDDITRLELNNQIIQAVRKRQKEFYEKYMCSE